MFPRKLFQNHHTSNPLGISYRDLGMKEPIFANQSYDSGTVCQRWKLWETSCSSGKTPDNIMTWAQICTIWELKCCTKIMESYNHNTYIYCLNDAITVSK